MSQADAHLALPTRRDEDWKYSDLRAALREDVVVLREGRDIIERLSPGTQRMTIPAGEVRTFVETMDSAHRDARSFEFTVEEGATLNRVVLQFSDAPALSMARIHLKEGARFNQFVLAEGGKLARIETHVTAAAPQAQMMLNGVYLAGAGKHADLTSVIDMQAPACAAEQLIKGAARTGGRGVFQGRIHVARRAQQTDARQYHHALILEDGAEIDAKPALEIYADDVSCAHGNTCGGLDEAALFYMQSRGIPEAEARALLTEAFLLAAAPDWLPNEVRALVEGRIGAWLREAP